MGSAIQAKCKGYSPLYLNSDATFILVIICMFGSDSIGVEKDF